MNSKFLVFFFFLGTGVIFSNKLHPINYDNTDNQKVSHQYFCESESIKLKDLIVFNTAGFHNILWYKTEVQTGKSLNNNLLVKDGDIYYAFQGRGHCFKSLKVFIHFKKDIPTPKATPNQSFCKYRQATLQDIKISKQEGFNSLFWFKDENQTSEAVNPETELKDGDIYYAFHGIGSCVKGAKINISINDENEPAPLGDSTYYCDGLCQLSDIKLQTDKSIYWFDTDLNTGIPLKESTVLEKGKTYYAYQSLSTCAEALPVKVLGKENENDWSFNIHPNPTCGVLYIEFENLNLKTQITITDANGKVFYQNNTAPNTSELEINLKDYSAGVYMVKINSGVKTKVEKVIVY